MTFDLLLIASIDSKLEEMKIKRFFIRRITLTLFACYLCGTILAQKIDLNTLNAEQLNLYKHKAVSMRNAGMILTFVGVGVVATSIIYENIPGTPNTDLTGDHSHNGGVGIFAIAIIDMVGITTTLVGVPLWAIGGSRKTKAEITLQKFNISPKNSMAFGLGLSFRF